PCLHPFALPPLLSPASTPQPCLHPSALPPPIHPASIHPPCLRPSALPPPICPASTPPPRLDPSAPPPPPGPASTPQPCLHPSVLPPLLHPSALPPPLSPASSPPPLSPASTPQSCLLSSTLPSRSRADIVSSLPSCLNRLFKRPLALNNAPGVNVMVNYEPDVLLVRGEGTMDRQDGGRLSDDDNLTFSSSSPSPGTIREDAA
ncbi:hypothetical protein NHX12_026618, partial [Muraenolepis orangiensis]